MPAGVEIFNDGGFYQIDSTYKNYRLTGILNVTLPGAAQSPPEVFPGVAVTQTLGINPVLAIRSTVLTSIAMVRTGTINFFQIRLASFDPGTAEVYVFDQTPPSASSSGLQVYDSVGNLVYDANDKSLRVLDYYEQGNVLTGTVVSRSYGGRKVALVVGGMLRFMNKTSPPGLQWEYLLGSRTVGDTQIDRGFFIYRRYLTGGGGPYISSRNVTDLVVDVTNY